MGLGVRDNEWEDRSVPPTHPGKPESLPPPASQRPPLGGIQVSLEKTGPASFGSFPCRSLSSYPIILTFSSPSGPQVKQLLGVGNGDHRGPGVSLGVVPHVSIAPL